MRTILSWYQSGGPYVTPLIVVGIAGLVVFVERLVRIVLRTKTNSRPFIEKVVSLVRAGKLDDALKLCAEHQSAVADLGLVLLRSKSRDEADLTHVATASTLTVVPSLTRRLAWLPALAMLGLLIGVLGCIAGIHDALELSARRSAEVNPALLDALAYALRPLGVATFTAIALVLFHAYLRNEANTIVDQLNEFAARLVNALLDRPDVRLGHR